MIRTRASASATREVSTVIHRLPHCSEAYAVGCRSGVMAVSDYQAGKVVATAPIDAGVPAQGKKRLSHVKFIIGASRGPSPTPLLPRRRIRQRRPDATIGSGCGLPMRDDYRWPSNRN
jgi:hypothetical protein